MQHSGQYLFRTRRKGTLKSDWEPHLERDWRPDLVYGLNRSNAMLKLLGARSRSESQPPGRFFAFGPFSDTKDSPIFPFFIFERRARSSGNSPEVALADCIAIHTLLKAQHALATASYGVDQNIGKPFVWFLSSGGAHWRLSGAYIDEKQSIPEFVSFVLLCCPRSDQN